MIVKQELKGKRVKDKGVVKTIIPIRCISCGRPIAHLWESYVERIKKGEDKKKVLDDLGLERYCCRSTLLTNVDLIDISMHFKKS